MNNSTSSPSLFCENNLTENLFLLSVNSATSLQQQIDQWKKYLQQHASAADHNAIRHTAYTLAVRRRQMPFRAFLTLQSDRELVEGGVTTKKTRLSPPNMIMVFSGQGTQWPLMGRDLIRASPCFQNDLIRMGEILHTALQIALYLRLNKLGIRPMAVIGHSSGEIAAAYVAGYTSLPYAMTLAYYRGYVAGKARGEQLEQQGLARRPAGGMGVVGLDAKHVSQFLRPGLCVACENSPSITTVSGDRKVLEEVLGSIQRDLPDILARLLKVDMAYHSHHMGYLAQEYQALVESEEASDPMTVDGGADEDDQDSHGHDKKIVFMSSVTCKTMHKRESFAPQ